MVFINKTVLSGGAKIDAPIFITFYQSIITVVGCVALPIITTFLPPSMSLPTPSLDHKILIQVSS